MTTYNKLVRDKIPGILDKKGVSYELRVASADEYKKELIIKLLEEANEFFEAKNSEELADVIEVVEALKTLDQFKDVESMRKSKREQKGGFDKKIILKGEK